MFLQEVFLAFSRPRGLGGVDLRPGRDSGAVDMVDMVINECRVACRAVIRNSG
jgi:hypothetical protein